jgi:hypothetical protein
MTACPEASSLSFSRVCFACRAKNPGSVSLICSTGDWTYLEHIMNSLSRKLKTVSNAVTGVRDSSRKHFDRSE